jgi:hypothetical protein
VVVVAEVAPMAAEAAVLTVEAAVTAAATTNFRS